MIERSMLFVPGSRPDMIAKAAASIADAVCIDLEDSVAQDDKPAARGNAIRAFQSLNWGRRLRMLRINGLDTPFAYRDMVDVIEATGRNIDLIMLPKVRCREDVCFVDLMLSQIEMHSGFGHRIGIEVLIESAAGFMNVREIASASTRIQTIVFGSGDYAASMRMPLGAIGEPDANDTLCSGNRWHAVMHSIVAAGRAHGLRCIDGPFAGFNNEAGFKLSCRVARALGFDGKQCIHPKQLSVANSVFSPEPDELAQAERIVTACAKSGVGTLDGRMIDAANFRMANWIVEQARMIREKDGNTDAARATIT